MSKLDKFLAKPKTYTIGGVEFKLTPLTVDNIDIVIKLEKEETKAEALKELFKITLKGAGVPEEEICRFGLEYFKEFVKAILEVNGLGEDQKKG